MARVCVLGEDISTRNNQVHLEETKFGEQRNRHDCFSTQIGLPRMYLALFLASTID